MDDILKDIYSDHQPQPSGSVDEVWKRIVAGDVEPSAADGGGGAMTLEDFLTKSGAVREEDIGVGAVGFEQFPAGYPAVIYGGGAAATGRGKRRAVEEPQDKATQQKQRRMIKNRESAARSRERKQVCFLRFSGSLFSVVFFYLSMETRFRICIIVMTFK